MSVACRDTLHQGGSTEIRFVRGRAGKPLLWSGELADPRLVAVPGEYRLRVQWAVGGDRDVRLTPWQEFVIGDATAAASFAAAATHEEGRKKYDACMLAPLQFPAFGELRNATLPGDGGTLFELLDSERVAACALLRFAPALPARVRARLDLLDIAKEARLAWASRDPALRRARWTMVEALAAAVLKAEPPRYYAELADDLASCACAALSHCRGPALLSGHQHGVGERRSPVCNAVAAGFRCPGDKWRGLGHKMSEVAASYRFAPRAESRAESIALSAPARPVTARVARSRSRPCRRRP